MMDVLSFLIEIQRVFIQRQMKNVLCENGCGMETQRERCFTFCCPDDLSLCCSAVLKYCIAVLNIQHFGGFVNIEFLENCQII